MKEYARYTTKLSVRLLPEDRGMLSELAEKSKLPEARIVRAILEDCIRRRYLRMKGREKRKPKTPTAP